MSSDSPSTVHTSISSTAQSDDLTQEPTQPERRPYEKPGFVVSRAFERQALSCAGCLNQSPSFPAFCAMKS
jgi:hypothetical protein